MEIATLIHTIHCGQRTSLYDFERRSACVSLMWLRGQGMDNLYCLYANHAARAQQCNCHTVSMCKRHSPMSTPDAWLSWPSTLEILAHTKFRDSHRYDHHEDSSGPHHDSAGLLGHELFSAMSQKLEPVQCIFFEHFVGKFIRLYKWDVLVLVTCCLSGICRQAYTCTCTHVLNLEICSNFQNVALPSM